MSWRISFYSLKLKLKLKLKLEQEILRLPPPLLARFLRYAERMEGFGPGFGMPHTRAMIN